MSGSFILRPRPLGTASVMALVALGSCARSPELQPPPPPPPPPPPIVLAPALAPVETVHAAPPIATVEPALGGGQTMPVTVRPSAPMRAPARSRPARSIPSGDPAEGPAEGPAAPDPAEPQRTYCERLMDHATPAECAYYDEIWKKMAMGTAGVRFPSDLTRGETGVVSLVIARGGSGGATSTEDLLGRRPDETFQLKISRRMAAMLHGEGFKIDPSGKQYRDFQIGEGLRWDWRVTALKARRHALTLSTYVVVQSPDGTRTENALKSVEKDIPVRVTMTQRFSDLVDWVVGISTLTKTLFGALGVILVALIAFRQRLGELKAAFVGK